MKRIITLFVLLAIFAIGVQAQIVGANEGKKTSTNTSSSLYRPTGHYLRFEVGFPNPSVAYAYQLSPKIMLGSGIGLGGMFYDCHHYGSYNSNWHQYSELGLGIPIYAEATFSQPKYKWALLIDIKIGINIPLEKSYREWTSGFDGAYHEEYKTGRIVFGALNAGIAYKNFSLCAGLSSNNTKWYSIFISYNLPLKVNVNR